MQWVNFLGLINRCIYALDESTSANMFLIFNVDVESINWPNRLGHIGQDMM